MESRSQAILADNLRSLRESHNHTLEYVGDWCGYSISPVHNWEQGKSMPSGAAIDRLADLYKVSFADLFTPKGAKDKAFTIAATFEAALEIVNRHMADGEFQLRKKKK